MLARTKARHAVMFGLGAAVILLVGCKAVEPTIPFGTWRGAGVLDYTYTKQDEPNAAPQHFARTYETSLDIKPQVIDGHDVIGIDILSKRGELPELEDQTHLQAILADVGSDGENTQRYRIVDLLLNPDPDDELSWKEADHVPSAAALVDPHGLSLHLQYGENFLDVLRFDGDTVTKNGAVYNKDGAIIHWAETLRRK